MKSETAYRADVIKRLEREFPGCTIIFNDPRYIQGLPDLLILFGYNWAMLEVKRSRFSEIQPNQEYYVEQFNRTSYAAFIYPENEERVFHELQYALCDRG